MLVGFRVVSEKNEFSLNVFTEVSEFSDKNNIILKKRLLYSNLLSLAPENYTLPHCQEGTVNRYLNWTQYF